MGKSKKNQVAASEDVVVSPKAISKKTKKDKIDTSISESPKKVKKAKKILEMVPKSEVEELASVEIKTKKSKKKDKAIESGNDASMEVDESPETKAEESNGTKKSLKRKREQDDVEKQNKYKVFIANISKSTNEEALKDELSSLGEVDNVYMPQKNENENKGYAFVSFKNIKSAKKAIAKTKEMEVDGRKLVIKTVKDKQGNKDSKFMRKNEYEIFVEKLARDVSAKDVKSYFSEFGAVASVNIPKDFGKDGTNRGFGFVTFENSAGYKAALATKSHLMNSKSIAVKGSAPTSAVEKTASKKTASETKANEIFVGKLNPVTAKSTIETHFSKYGKINRITLPYDKLKKTNKGFCYVAFKMQSSMSSALAEDHEIDESILKVSDGAARGTEFLTKKYEAKVNYDHEVFVKGLKYETTMDALQSYFSDYKGLVNVTLPMARGKNKGFCFVAFSKASTIDKLMEKKHQVDGKTLHLRHKKNSDKPKTVVKEKEEKPMSEEESDEEETGEESDEEVDEDESDDEE